MQRPRLIATRAALAAALAPLVLVPATAATASLAHPRIVSTNPADTTPHAVDDGTVANARVFVFTQSGSTMYAGGLFRTVKNPAVSSPRSTGSPPAAWSASTPPPARWTRAFARGSPVR
jgi:hypothetical protein